MTVTLPFPLAVLRRSLSSAEKQEQQHGWWSRQRPTTPSRFTPRHGTPLTVVITRALQRARPIPSPPMPTAQSTVHAQLERLSPKPVETVAPKPAPATTVVDGVAGAAAATRAFAAPVQQTAHPVETAATKVVHATTVVDGVAGAAAATRAFAAPVQQTVHPVETAATKVVHATTVVDGTIGPVALAAVPVLLEKFSRNLVANAARGRVVAPQVVVGVNGAVALLKGYVRRAW